MATPRKGKPAATAPFESSAPQITLEHVQDATKAGNIVYTSAEFHTPFIKSGEVEINPSMTDEHGNIATRAIFKEETTMTETATVAATAKPVFAVESGLAIPDRVRKTGGARAGRTPVYPFDGLEVGGSFFVADKSADKPAVKAMASTVAGANARYSEEVEGQTRINRKGAVVPVTKQLRLFKVFDTHLDPADTTSQKGARVFRVAIAE